jgi:oxygen tolerance protein BatD
VSALVLLALIQIARPELHVSVDQDRVSVGEELTYTVRAVSHSSDPMNLSVAPMNGFEILSRSERTEVSFSGGPVRTTTLELRLRALRPGRWQIGPARAVQGRDVLEADAVVVDVDPSPVATATALNPRLRILMERAPPPPRGKAAVALVVSSDTVTVGEQVDVVTAAWFPRDLRLQLRRPPTLQPPVIDGVWSYPQATPAGIAVTRTMAGSTYDLFVSHQVIFPLVPGTIAIPRAMLKYSTPLALQFFSQEERFALSSPPETLVVRPLPTLGRTADFNGAIGSALKLERRITPATARPGEGVAVELSLSGEGNSALWPPPAIKWPLAVRSYVDRVDEQVSTQNGRLGGTKTFRYLVVPDSAGAVTLPAVSYGYFDLATRSYRSATASSATLPVAVGGDAALSVALPPELLVSSGPPLSWRVAHGVPLWLAAALLILPPLVVLSRGKVRLQRRGAPPVPIPGLRAAEETLDAVVRGLVPDPDQRSRAGLAAAVRAAGADAETASRIATVRERLLARRYGPAISEADDAALTREVDEVVRRLGVSLRGWRRRGVLAGLLLMLATSLESQAPSPEQLYQSGSLRAAAEGFFRRVDAQPAVAADWYNLGASYYRLGEKGRAAAAWVRARRLDPREPTIARALRLTPPPPDGSSARWLWTPPVTSEELLVLGTLAWIVGWVGWVLRPRSRDRWTVLLIGAAIALVGGWGLHLWYRRPIAIAVDQTTLRLSPHGRAPTVSKIEEGAALRVIRAERGWVLVRAAGSQQGWLPNDALVGIGGRFPS